jgi:regulator of protease activity HflC (stomatin/prohibitin superfamily)
MAKPWWAEQTGKAELAQAEQNRQIAVKEAQAKADAAILLAQAEVSRAEGVAKANKIIGESLKENEDYLRYLWITDVAGSNIDKTVVYVPTETNLPILEATRNIK